LLDLVAVEEVRGMKLRREGGDHNRAKERIMEGRVVYLTVLYSYEAEL